MATNPPLNVARELGSLLNGEALETLLDELVDPGSHFTEGQRAKIGAALEIVGAKITADVKEELKGVQRHFDDDVLFRWQAEGSSTRVNTDEVKKQYSEKQHPSLYYKSVTAARVNIDLPFSKTEIALPTLPEAAPPSPESVGEPLDMFAQQLPEPF